MYRLDLLCFEPPFRFSLRTLRTCALQPETWTIVATCKDEFIGFIIVELRSGDQPASGYVITIDVHPGHRRKGVAAAMMIDAERRIAGEGARQIGLHVSTKNETAIKFYESLGYVVRSRVEGFYAPSEDAWLYSKSLGVESESSEEKSSGRSR